VSAALRTTDSSGVKNSENTGTAVSAKPKPVNDRRMEANTTTDHISKSSKRPISAMSSIIKNNPE
jgi:hypothetical protein